MIAWWQTLLSIYIHSPLNLSVGSCLKKQWSQLRCCPSQAPLHPVVITWPAPVNEMWPEACWHAFWENYWFSSN
jgi:hypothetical protein